MNVLALDFGGSSVKYGIISDDGTMFESGKVPAPLESVKAFTDSVCQLYTKYSGSVEGIGISLPGNIDPESGILYGSGVYQQLYGNSIIQLVEDVCHTKASVENDGKCGALAESWHGALKDCKDGVVIILGTGIAGGVIKNHRIHSGKGFNAGEFSYQITDPGDYSMMSTASMSVGMLGVTYKLCKLMNLDLSVQDAAPTLEYLDSIFASRYNKFQDNPKKIKADGKQFLRWVDEKDETALAVYREFQIALGALVFNTQICYAPDRIVIGGGLSADERILVDLQKELEKYYNGMDLGERMQSEVVKSDYMDEANLYGATYNYLIHHG